MLLHLSGDWQGVLGNSPEFCELPAYGTHLRETAETYFRFISLKPLPSKDKSGICFLLLSLIIQVKANAPQRPDLWRSPLAPQGSEISVNLLPVKARCALPAVGPDSHQNPANKIDAGGRD